MVTATTSREPVFDGNWLAEGTLVCAVGSNWLNKAEIDSHVIRRADNIVCDSVKACQNEAGDFVDALEKGIFDWSRAVDLADVVTGLRHRPQHAREHCAVQIGRPGDRRRGAGRQAAGAGPRAGRRPRAGHSDALGVSCRWRRASPIIAWLSGTHFRGAGPV